MMYRVRNPVLTLVLCLVTCGIYNYIAIYQISDDLRSYTNRNDINPGLEVILCLITCGLYGIYWCWKYSKLIYEIQCNIGVPYASDISLPALILPIFGLFLVSLLLIQTELNKIWERLSTNQ